MTSKQELHTMVLNLQRRVNDLGTQMTLVNGALHLQQKLGEPEVDLSDAAYQEALTESTSQRPGVVSEEDRNTVIDELRFLAKTIERAERDEQQKASWYKEAQYKTNGLTMLRDQAMTKWGITAEELGVSPDDVL